MILRLFTVNLLISLLSSCSSHDTENIQVRNKDFDLGKSPRIVTHTSSNISLTQTYSTEMTEPLLNFNSQAKNIFNKTPFTIDKESSKNTRKTASLLISIKKGDLNSSSFENDVMPIIVKNGWEYKGKYSDNYIFCNEIQDLLEVALPKNITFEVKEGYALVPQEDIWNIGFFADIGGVRVCLDRYKIKK